ncbi:hypothetical protein CI109_106887 [Kwoniella shandongensis]|uniref:Uncharacterized protein n=1 Tax=Kwoniella shandongensis TaxID=1734106 RepID=A0A5M6C6B3_9TREE|nr:uncharacterized protein CI109_000857 [Kwoniella shandongensis]KAA5530677.1 hypothetical protein CI109_000857 [Kwoniella shandongensis]
MSLLPTLRAQASTSSITPFAQLVRPHPLLQTAATRIRFASTSTPNTAKSVQDVEKELEEQRAMISRSARMNPGMDVTSQVLPVFESYIDPPKPVTYFLNRSKDREYKLARRERSNLTIQSVAELISRGGINQYRNSFWRWYAPGPMRNLWIYIRRDGMLKKELAELKEKYYDYMRVQASGTLGQASHLAKDNALSIAQSVIKGRRDKLTWQLVKENVKPRLVSARMTIMDPRDMRMAAQMVVTFDTQQALVTQKGNATPTRRTQRVLDHIIFERLIPAKDGSGWKIKGKLLEPKVAAKAE